MLIKTSWNWLEPPRDFCSGNPEIRENPDRNQTPAHMCFVKDFRDLHRIKMLVDLPACSGREIKLKFT